MLSERIEKWSRELIEKGRAEGELKGRTEGELKGRAEGLTEGELKGRTETLLATATALLHKGISTSEISEITGLSQEEIEMLRRDSL